MCIIKELGRFVRRGVTTFRYASRGQYHREAEGVRDIREELFENESHRSDDRRNLKKDRMAVERDVRMSFNKCHRPIPYTANIAAHGQSDDPKKRNKKSREAESIQ